MTIVPVFFTSYPLLPQVTTTIEEMAQSGVYAVFRARSMATTQQILGQMDRRERIVLILLDGKRTIQDIARLIYRSERDIARILVRFLRCNYIEFLGAQRPMSYLF